LDCPQKVAIEISIEVAREAPLDANFGSAAIPSFLCAANDFFERKRIGIRGGWTTAEAAKTAAYKADIREINVAIDDVGDRFPDRFAPQIVRDRDKRLQSVAVGSRKFQSLLKRKFLATQDGIERLLNVRRAQSNGLLEVLLLRRC